MVLSKEIHAKLHKMYGMGDKKKGPNDHIGEPIDAPVGHMPRVVKVPMHDKADVNPKFHAAKEEEKASKTPDVKKGVGWSDKDERQYNHIKESGESESIAAATVNKQRRKEGRTKVSKSTPNVSIVKGGPGSGRRKGGGVSRTSFSGPPPVAVRAPSPKPDASNDYLGYGEGSKRQSARAHAASQRANEAEGEASSHAQSYLHAQAAHEHEGAAEFHTIAQNHEEASKHKALATAHRRISDSVALQKSGVSMAKNEVSDLFKAELGNNPSAPITNCVHCKHSLTHEDLKKGLGTHFVVDDNDNPHDGSESGFVEPSRAGGGVPEHDTIAPLLKSCKGPEAGEQEEYPISKSEMVQMGMEVGEMEEGWYTISKAEMKRVEAGDHIAYLESRKALISKSVKTKPGGGANIPPRGASPIKPREAPIKKGHEELTVWVDTGTDKYVSEYIEKMGNFGQGNDESIRTQGNGKY